MRTRRVMRSKLLIVISIGMFVGVESCKKELATNPGGGLSEAASADTGVIVSTYAGSTQGYVDGPAFSAKFKQANYLCMGADSILYVADSNVLRMIDKNGIVSTLAGGATVRNNQTPADGTGSQASFIYLQSMAAAPDGKIYVTDGDYYPWFRTVNAEGEVITFGHRFGPDDVIIAATPDTTIYGTETDYGFLHYGFWLIHETLIGEPTELSRDELEFNRSFLALIVDRNNAVYYLASRPSGIDLYKMTNERLYSPSSPMRTASLKQIKLTSQAQPASIARGGGVDRLAVAADGTVYITEPHRVLKVTSGGNLSVLAGNEQAGYNDGPAAQARFEQIQAIELAQNGEVLYVSDNFRIRKIMLKQ